MATLLILAVGVVAGAFVTRAIGQVDSSRHIQDSAEARAQAQAALADAIFQMDQETGPLEDHFCVVPLGSSSSCTKSELLDGATIQYAAKTTDDSTYSLEIEATVHGVSVAAEATTLRKPLDPLAIFAGASVTFNGHSTTVNVHATDKSGASTGGYADVGSDGSITCHGSGSYGTGQVTYGGGSSNCPEWQQMGADYIPQDPSQGCPAPVSTPPTPCMPSSPTPEACPNNGVFSGTQNDPFVLEPGVYKCTGQLEFEGPVEIDYTSRVNDGKVQIYDFPPSGGSTEVQIGSSAEVNLYDASVAGSCSEWTGTSAPVESYDCGDPTALQLYVAGPCSEAEMEGGALFDGYLYAPSCAVTLDGSQVIWTGAFVLGQFTANGNPNLVVNYDDRMSQLVPSVWSISNWAWISPAQFVVPSQYN